MAPRLVMQSSSWGVRVGPGGKAARQVGRSEGVAKDTGLAGWVLYNTAAAESVHPLVRRPPTCSSSEVAVAAPVVRLTAKVACSTRQALPEMVVPLAPVERTELAPQSRQR